ncbi:MAG: hypothetical protein M3033_11490 [Acidobacteriota bacterium]|nr:hypothetical protein [Acidobacteriota bacterium]
MSSVRCTVTLLSDKNRKVEIQLWKAGNDSFLWKVIESAGGNLRLPAAYGTWFSADFADILTLYHMQVTPKMQAGMTLTAYKVKSDFLSQIASGNTIVTDDAELYNGNVTEGKVSCKLERMN